MNERDPLIVFLGPPSQVCPSCGATNVRMSIQVQRFPYGVAERAVQLEARVPVGTCGACGFEFTGEDAEDSRHEAVCRHLGVMAPAEVKGLRKLHGMNRAQFAEVTRLGEASLARWESGQKIQNPAYDQFLYLLTFPDNMARLKTRGGDAPPPLSRRQNAEFISESAPGTVGSGRFRALTVTADVKKSALEFRLRKTGS